MSDSPQVFISYVRENAEIVDRLRRELAYHGIDSWVDRYSLKPGDDWKTSIRRAISHGVGFVACSSEEYWSRSASYMNEELSLALEELRKRRPDDRWFLPVVLSGDIPDLDVRPGRTLRDLVYVDLRSEEDWENGVAELCEAILPGAVGGALRAELFEDPSDGAYVSPKYLERDPNSFFGTLVLEQVDLTQQEARDRLHALWPSLSRAGRDVLRYLVEHYSIPCDRRYHSDSLHGSCLSRAVSGEVSESDILGINFLFRQTLDQDSVRELRVWYIYKKPLKDVVTELDPGVSPKEPWES